MNIAKLDRFIIIQSKSTSVDAYGNDAGTYSNFASVWANRTSKVAEEFFEGSTITSETIYTYTIRYRSDLNSKMRLLDGDETFDILAITHADKRGSYTRLLCREVR